MFFIPPLYRLGRWWCWSSACWDIRRAYTMCANRLIDFFLFVVSGYRWLHIYNSNFFFFQIHHSIFRWLIHQEKRMPRLCMGILDTSENFTGTNVDDLELLYTPIFFFSFDINWFVTYSRNYFWYLLLFFFHFCLSLFFCL